uniref:Rab3 GTPase-activating protein catalytic subunit n=1 Tax=Gadus morhua TaxID=8049 RepID=A0A8C5CA70_GADMO
GCPLTPLPPVTIAIRFTYVLQDWQQYSWPQQPPDFDALLGGEVGGVEFGKLPFGACEDPISELHLATTWPHLTEGIVVDNDVYSDLDPLQAPHWSVRVRKAENPQCLLGDFLNEFFKLCCRKESTEEILGRGLTEEEGKENTDLSAALSKLTEPAAAPMSKLSVSSMVHSARKHIRRHRRVDESPLSNDVLNSILLVRHSGYPAPFFIFYESKLAKLSTIGCSFRTLSMCDFGKWSNLFNQLKSAPSDSLTYRLALCVCLVNFYHGGVRALAHLWQEFVLEMRFRWENNHLVYGLASGAPDLRCCLLHQKLQMLNCCIERKRARDESRKASDGGKERDRPLPGGGENGRRSRREGAASPGKSWDSWSDSEDEFFECLSDQEEAAAAKEGEAEKGGAGRAKPPDGRLHPHGTMTLLNPSTEPMYIPVTQEPAPMTEDLLEEQSEVLAKLGTTAEGAHLRARMQSACLLSDMESFKAANPGCSLEDFVRWYSPRDYVEEEVVDEAGAPVLRGELSARMKIPGNMWAEAWDTARSVPARRQKRLFDDTKEAEKVLHYLSVQKPADLTRHLLPCILHAAVLKLKEEESLEDIPSVKKAVQQATSHASKQLRHPNPDHKKLEEVISQLVAVETVIARARSLKAKFGIGKAEAGEDSEDLEKFVISLLEEPEVAVLGAGRGPAGSIIHKLFVSSQRVKRSPLKPMGGGLNVPDFPPPAGREILLRTCVPRPAPYSKALPQRLFCVLLREDFRLAGALSSDTSFF